MGSACSWCEAKHRALDAVRANGMSFSELPEVFRHDRRVVLAAVRQNGFALQYASEELKADRTIVLEAVQNSGTALQFAAEELKADRQIVLEAVRQQGLALEDASQELRADREVVLLATTQTGYAMYYAADELKADRDFVLQAAGRSGLALQYASRPLRADRGVVLEAVQQNSCALEHASADLKRDYAFVLEAVRGNPDSFYRLPREMRQDRPVLLAFQAGRFSVLSARRIVHDAKVMPKRGLTCVASFPGICTQEWDDLAKRQPAMSSACVFLSGPNSGLGRHSEPCACQEIYGRLDASSYVRVMLKPSSTPEEQSYEERLRLAEADARAMGQLFLEEVKYDAASFQQVREDKIKEARPACEANGCRAPWGCLWFELWQQNVLRAVELEQVLQVYYFEGMVGKGKVTWDDLSNADIVKQAQSVSGLGSSQRVEVAWLDKMSIPYVERDVREVKRDMRL